MGKDAVNTSDAQSQGKETSLSDHFTLDAAAKSIAAKPITYEREGNADLYKHRRIYSEEAAFREIDPHLAALYKDLRNYQRRYKETLAAFGEDDPMLEIIADQVDSARSAYETRLIEIKRNHGIVAAGLSLYKSVKEHIAEEEERKDREKVEAELEEKWKRFAAYIQSIQAAKRKKDKEGLDALLLVIIALFLKQRPDYGLFMTQQRI